MKETVVHGIDMYRFPRAIPEEVKVIDTFPLVPIPEEMAPVMSDLRHELALAHAPLSGKRVACVLAGAHEGYGGHVVEHTPTNAIDPFTMALDKMPAGARILGVMVSGEGVIKEKHVLPSGVAYDKIAPLLVPGSPIVIVPPNQTSLCRFIPESMHQVAYKPKAPSVFQGRNVFESQIEALERTALCMEDCEFVAHLRHAGLEEGIHYYLTGSANGHSGPSYAVRPGMYRDLDIIAVSNKSKEDIEGSFESLAEAWYGPLNKEQKTVGIAGSVEKLSGCMYSGLGSGICIDFYATDRLETAFVRPEHFTRNFFHQLS